MQFNAIGKYSMYAIQNLHWFIFWNFAIIIVIVVVVGIVTTSNNNNVTTFIVETWTLFSFT